MYSLPIRILFCVALSLALQFVHAQGAPEGISYQAIVRDPSGNEIVNESVSIEFAVRSVSPDGPIAYEEFHAMVSTNQYGLFHVSVGSGVNTGNGLYNELSALPWGSADYFLEVRATIPGQGASEIIGVTQLLTVPYAFYANRAETVAIESDGDTQNELIDDFSLNGAVLTITENNADYSIDLSGLLAGGGDNDNDPQNELIESAQLSNNNVLTITEAGVNTSVDLDQVAHSTWSQSQDAVFQDQLQVGIGTAEPQSRLHVNGSVSFAVATLSEGLYDLSVLSDLANKHVFICRVTDGDVNIELPSAAASAGRTYMFRKYFDGAVTSNDVNLSAVSGEFVDGQVIYGMDHIYAEYLTIISDGLNWYVIEHAKE
jgi:hypothetical protein